MSAAPQLAREYELVYILRPTVGPSEAKKVSDRITDVIDKNGAKLTRVDNWGKRKLAYQIDKHTRGVFVYVTFVAPTGLVAELERNLRILDPVIRYQTVRLDTLHDISELNIDPSEVEFVDVEVGDDDDDDPTFEEQLGMRPPVEEPPAEEPEAEKAQGDGDDSEGEDESGDDAKADASSDDASGDDASSDDDSSDDDSSEEKEG